MKKLMLVPAALLLAATTVVAGPGAHAAPTAAPAAAPAASSATVSTTAPAARAGKTRCMRGSSSYSGRCFTLLRSKVKSVVVEAVPLQNKTRKKRVNMHCSFTTTISKTVEVGGEVSASVEAGLFGTVKASVTATVHKNISQTAEQATSAGGDVTLKPGEKVICKRTYGHVIARVKDYRYNGKKSSTTIRRVKIPSRLGVIISD